MLRGLNTRMGGPPEVLPVCFLTGRILNGNAARVSFQRLTWNEKKQEWKDGDHQVSTQVHEKLLILMKERPGVTFEAADGHSYRVLSPA